MATITTDTFLDNGTARTSNESWTLNGGKLTIRTDTRWHANAPASMTGTIGTTTSNGGGLLVDGRNVRWMAYDTGTGNVPAIGTTITQGGVSGYLLGVWANYTSAPTAVGAAMPASGFLKFREVTGGPYSAGALTGIGANATSADVAGWIEYVQTSVVYYAGSVSGSGFVVDGDWFYLDDTTGSPGQTIQVPTNGGGSGTTVCAVQIETSPGSGLYDWWLSSPTATYWATSYFATDKRAKIFEQVGGGLIRIGANSGGTPIGFTPPGGCKVRIGNVFMRMATSGAAATNQLPSTSFSSRPGWSGIGTISISKADCPFQFGTSSPAPFSTAILTDTGVDSLLSFTSMNITLTRVAQGVTVNIAQGIQINNCTGILSSCVFAVTGNPTFTSCSNLSIDDCWFTRYTTSQGTLNFTYCVDLEITNLKTVALGVARISCVNVNITGYDYTHFMFGPTASTAGVSAVVTDLACNECSWDGLVFGYGDTLANSQSPQSLVSVTRSINMDYRNFGSFSSPLNSGGNASYYVNNLLSQASNGYNSGISFKRIYVNNNRGNPVGIGNAVNKNFIFENLVFPGGNQGFSGNDVFFKGFRCGTMLAPPSSPGMPFSDAFVSDTSGRFFFAFGSTPTEASSPFITSSITSGGTAGYDYNNNLNMNTIGDEVTIETPYWVLGHTGFAASGALASGTTGSKAYTYALDTGSGYGSWVTLSSANLAAETLNPAGTKMKIRVEKTSSSNNAQSTITLNTLSTSTAQTANLYPLDTNTLELTGLVAGSEVRAYTGTDPATAVEIGGTESSGTSFSFTHSAGGSVGFIRVFALGYQPFNYDPYTYEADDVTLLVQQVVDRNYVNP